MPVPFDTDQFVQDMTDAGMPSAQARVLSKTLQQVYSDSVVTKSDLGEAVLKVDNRFTALEGKVDNRFTEFQGKVDTRFAAIEGQLTHLRYLGYAIFAASVVKLFIN